MEDGPSTNTPFAATNKSGLTVEPSSAIPQRNLQINKLAKESHEKRRQAIDTFLAQPRDSQRKLVEDKWAILCYELVNKAMTYQRNVTDKDFGKLCQLIISAATAKDKVFHKDDAVQKSGNVVFNLFGNVGLDAIKRMLQPPTPKEIPHAQVIDDPPTPPVDGV